MITCSVVDVNVVMYVFVVFVFFFKQKTAYEVRSSDWSSDVCSSDLLAHPRSRGDERSAQVEVPPGDQGRQDRHVERAGPGRLHARRGVARRRELDRKSVV